MDPINKLKGPVIIKSPERRGREDSLASTDAAKQIRLERESLRPSAFADQARLALAPLWEATGKFDWGFVVCAAAFCVIYLAAGDLLSLLFDLPPPDVKFTGQQSPEQFLLRHYSYYGPGAILVMAAAFISLRAWTRNLRQARRIEDIPTSTARGAAQGEVEVHGKAMAIPGDPLSSPLSHTTCVWHSHRITHKRRDSKGKTYDAIVEDGASLRPFLLDDGTGLIVILPPETTMTHLPDRKWQPETGVTNREQLILDGDVAYAWGNLRTLHGPWGSGQTIPAGITAEQLENIAQLIATRYPGSPPEAPLLFRMYDDSPVVLGANSQYPLIESLRRRAKLSVGYVFLMAITGVMIWQVLRLAVHAQP